MIGVVVAAHGELAQALVSTAQLVVQEHGTVVAVGIEARDDTASYEARLQAAVLEVLARTRACWCSPTCSAARRRTSG